MNQRHEGFDYIERMLPFSTAEQKSLAMEVGDNFYTIAKLVDNNGILQEIGNKELANKERTIIATLVPNHFQNKRVSKDERVAGVAFWFDTFESFQAGKIRDFSSRHTVYYNRLIEMQYNTDKLPEAKFFTDSLQESSNAKKISAYGFTIFTQNHLIHLKQLTGDVIQQLQPTTQKKNNQPIPKRRP